MAGNILEGLDALEPQELDSVVAHVRAILAALPADEASYRDAALRGRLTAFVAGYELGRQCPARAPS